MFASEPQESSAFSGHGPNSLLWNVISQHQGFDKGSHAIALEALWQQISWRFGSVNVFSLHLVFNTLSQVAEALHNLVEGTSVGISVMHNLHQLDGTTLHQLIHHESLMEDRRFLALVWLEATCRLIRQITGPINGELLEQPCIVRQTKVSMLFGLV